MKNTDNPLHPDFQPVFTFSDRLKRHRQMVLLLLLAIQRLNNDLTSENIKRENKQLPPNIGEFRAESDLEAKSNPFIWLVLPNEQARGIPPTDRKTMALRGHSFWTTFIEEAIALAESNTLEFNDEQAPAKTIIERLAHHLEICAWSQYFHAHENACGYWLAFEPHHLRMLGGANVISARIDAYLDGRYTMSTEKSWISLFEMAVSENSLNLQASVSYVKGRIIPNITASVAELSFEQWALRLTINKPLPSSLTAGLINRPANKLIDCPWLDENDVIVGTKAYADVTTIDLAALKPLIIPMPRVIFKHDSFKRA